MKTHLACIFSDTHMDDHWEPGWRSFQRFVAETKPTLIVGAGDLVNMTPMSRWDKRPRDAVYAIKQMRYAIKEFNALLPYCKALTLMPGNHDQWWEKVILERGPALDGAKGLTVKDQMYAQGLNPKIRWVEETNDCPGLVIGKSGILVRHGHRTATSRVNIAGSLLRNNATGSSIVGHHHRAELSFNTSLGVDRFAIANPHLSKEAPYAPWPNWQRGFTILELYGAARMRDCRFVSPHLVVMDKFGRFSYGGKVWAP